MMADVLNPENRIGTAQIQSLHNALRAIKDNQCQKCGTQAKGFVYRKKLPVYYCKRCLYDEFGVERRI